MPILSIGDEFPDFSLLALKGGNLSKMTDIESPDDYFQQISSEDNKDKWKIIFFWPKDFTFVCPTEIAGFGHLSEEFSKHNAIVLGASVDNEYVHYQWRMQHPELKNLPFPMLSDLNRDLAAETGVLNEDGVADRATFIVDPNNKIQFVSVTADSVGRNVEEVLRVLTALQSEELTPCGWNPGDATLNTTELIKG